MSLNCDTYDYIEVMCLYRYEVRVTLVNTTTLTAIFYDTGFIVIEAEKQESIIGHNSKSSEPINIPLSSVKSIEVLTPNAQFSQIMLNRDS